MPGFARIPRLYVEAALQSGRSVGLSREQAQPFDQMLQHVVNHGSYHRGQVTTMLRQLGMPPARQMDLITFYRESAART